MNAWRWVALGGAVIAAACGGVSTIGSGSEPTATSGGSGVTPGGTNDLGRGGGVDQTGATSTGASSARGGQGSAAASGVGSAGQNGDPVTGGVTQPDTCKSDADCDDPAVPCQECADGSYACNKAFCNGGTCAHRNETCPAGCMSDRDCPVLGLACMQCADGSKSCPSTACLKGKCQTSFSGCNNVDPCKGLVCGTQCKQCESGECANLPLYCGADRKCEPGIPQCGSDLKCSSALDCGEPPPNCVACGADVCAAFECVEGACVFSCPSNPHPECQTTRDCPATGVCKMCPDHSCAAHVCWKGNCELACEPQ